MTTQDFKMQNLQQIKKVNKLWGHEFWLQKDGGAKDGYCGKILVYQPDALSSFHFHPIKTEHMVIWRGTGFLETLPPVPDGTTVQYDEDTRTAIYTAEDGTTTHEAQLTHILPEDVLYFPARTPHRIQAREELVVFEVSTPHNDSDVIRLTESRRIDNE